jgi:hypothetical protein
MTEILDRIKEVVAQIDKVQAEGRDITEAEKENIQSLLLSIAEYGMKELRRKVNVSNKTISKA